MMVGSGLRPMVFKEAFKFCGKARIFICLFFNTIPCLPKITWTRGKSWVTRNGTWIHRTLCNIEWRSRLQEGSVKHPLMSNKPKLGWQTLFNEGALLARILRSKKCQVRIELEAFHSKNNASNVWREVMDSVKALRQGLRPAIGNGRSTLFDIPAYDHSLLFWGPSKSCEFTIRSALHIIHNKSHLKRDPIWWIVWHSKNIPRMQMDCLALNDP
ncbi:hypothetical protein Cgig2_022707 [Carnegiea gigantea]|uniref:Uncharacterized protein n=1 Tax=Carnegiea gigantea TaxID=171969 RepID=A0A9Q1QCL0_9CARY|nr:hypothetical protein Cgig2_022707 [Carnegiea gigantea]